MCIKIFGIIHLQWDTQELFHIWYSYRKPFKNDFLTHMKKIICCFCNYIIGLIPNIPLTTNTLCDEVIQKFNLPGQWIKQLINQTSENDSFYRNSTYITFGIIIIIHLNKRSSLLYPERKSETPHGWWLTSVTPWREQRCWAHMPAVSNVPKWPRYQRCDSCFGDWGRCQRAPSQQSDCVQ